MADRRPRQARGLSVRSSPRALPHPCSCPSPTPRYRLSSPPATSMHHPCYTSLILPSRASFILPSYNPLGVPQNCETRPATARLDRDRPQPVGGQSACVAWHTTDTAVSDRGQERRGGGPHPTAVGVCLPCDRRRRPVSATCHFFGVHPNPLALHTIRWASLPGSQRTWRCNVTRHIARRHPIQHHVQYPPIQHHVQCPRPARFRSIRSRYHGSGSRPAPSNAHRPAPSNAHRPAPSNARPRRPTQPGWRSRPAAPSSARRRSAPPQPGPVVRAARASSSACRACPAVSSFPPSSYPPFPSSFIPTCRPFTLPRSGRAGGSPRGL